MGLELVVTPGGHAMVLHRGALEYKYLWAQYEPFNSGVELVTEDGDIHSLGFEVSGDMKLPLLNTRELLLVQMSDDDAVAGARLVKFTALGG